MGCQTREDEEKGGKQVDFFFFRISRQNEEAAREISTNRMKNEQTGERTNS